MSAEQPLVVRIRYLLHQILVSLSVPFLRVCCSFDCSYALRLVGDLSGTEGDTQEAIRVIEGRFCLGK